MSDQDSPRQKVLAHGVAQLVELAHEGGVLLLAFCAEEFHLRLTLLACDLSMRYDVGGSRTNQSSQNDHPT
jgi:hypothetical protein